MKKFLLFTVLCTLLFKFSSANQICNDYVDTILRDLKQDKEAFQDPYVIPEKHVEVSRKLVFINYTGEARIYDGYIFGLSTLQREGDVVVDKSNQVHLKLWLGAGELNLKCSGTLKLMGHGPKVSIDAVVKYVSMKMDLIPTKEGSNPKIVNFKIEEVKGKDIKVSGLGPLSFFLQKYLDVISKVFKGLIKYAIEVRLKDFLARKIKDYVIPEGCLTVPTW